MPAKALESMDDFTNHSGSSSGGSGVLSWREEDEGQLDIVLHTKAPIYALWSSSWYYVDKDRETGKDKVFYTRINSMEDDKVLSKQRFRARDDKEAEEFKHRYPWQTKEQAKGFVGIRQHPPVLCPMSLTIEWVREQCEIGDIGIADKIFEFEGDEDSIVIHAGCFCGIVGGKDADFSKEELKALREAKIRPSEAYKEDGKPRMQYVICAVDYAHPEAGAQVLIEAQSLGDKLKKAVTDRKEDLGEEDGDPKKTPVVFRLTYDSSKDYSAKYDVKVRTKAELTPEVLEAVTGDWPRDKVERIVADSNLVQLRRSFEKHWCHKKVTPPWAAIFAAAEAFAKGTAAMEDPQKKKGKEESKDDSDGDGSSDSGSDDESSDDEGSDDEGSASDDASDDELVACEHCEGAMKGTDDTCPHCGATYDADGVMTPPKPKEEPKKLRSRAAAAAGKAPTRPKS